MEREGTKREREEDNKEPVFPVIELARLNEMITQPHWVVPVLPKGELEVLLEAAIHLCRKGLDIHSADCQRFFHEGLTVSFTKILTYPQTSSWALDIHKGILKNAEKLVELCVYKLSQDCRPLLDLLAMVFNPACKFHSFNGTKPSELLSQLTEDELFARPPRAYIPKGWLVDLVNKFGQLGGFQALLDHFLTQPNHRLQSMAALIRPFGLCYEVLTPKTVETYFIPIVEFVLTFLDGLTDEEMEEETETDVLTGLIRDLKCLLSCIPSQVDTVKNLEIVHLKVILRMLHISSLEGKMKALTEVDRIITNVSCHPRNNDEDWLTARTMVEWIHENNVLSVIISGNFHEPQYMEKWNKIVCFMMKEEALSLRDLDILWQAQDVKPEAFVKNLHKLLNKLAWDFSQEQFDHLLECIQGSWANAAINQRQKLLELIHLLAADDMEGIMSDMVQGLLDLLWKLAHSDDGPTDTLYHALSTQITILKSSNSQMSENRPNTPHSYYRHQIISHLQSQHGVVKLITQNLIAYMSKARLYQEGHPETDPSVILPDSRFSHIQQVQERLQFLVFFLRDGQLWICEPQVKQIWVCLVQNAVYPCDRETCFKWFSELMVAKEPDLDPVIMKNFLEENILQLDPSLLGENGLSCFEVFFKAVNSEDGHIVVQHCSSYMTHDLDLIGLDYLWWVVSYGTGEVSEKATAMLKDIYGHLDTQLQSKQTAVHEDLLQHCMDGLKASYDKVSAFDRDKDGTSQFDQEVSCMIRLMTQLHEYVTKFDNNHSEGLADLSLSSPFRGQHLTLLVHFLDEGSEREDIDIWSHTHKTIGSVRHQVMSRVNNKDLKVDLYVNGKRLERRNDRKLISQLPICDKTLITVKLNSVDSDMSSNSDCSVDSDTSSSSDNNSDSETDSSAENCLPSMLMSSNPCYAKFFVQLAELGSQLQISKLRECACNLLQFFPGGMEGCHPDFTVVDKTASVTLVIEGHRLYVHHEVLAAWSPVFRAMFVQDFKEKSMAEIELPGKKVKDFVQLLHCIYPPIQETTDANVFHLLPLTEEYQISEVKKRCEEYLLTRPGSMELLITAQTYGLTNLLVKCIEFVRQKTLAELQRDAFFKSIHLENVVKILTLRCKALENKLEQSRKPGVEPDV